MIVLHKDNDITDYISSMSWGGSKSQMARKLELKIVNAPLDPNVQKLEIALADPIYLFEDDGKTELFRGFITEREASSTTGTVSYVAYDILFYISLPTELYGSETSGLAAYFYNSQTGWRIARLGGGWSSGATCSAWYFYLNNASSNLNGDIGGRLLYVPQGTHDEDEEVA